PSARWLVASIEQTVDRREVVGENLTTVKVHGRVGSEGVEAAAKAGHGDAFGLDEAGGARVDSIEVVLFGRFGGDEHDVERVTRGKLVNVGEDRLEGLVHRAKHVRRDGLQFAHDVVGEDAIGGEVLR